VDKIVKDVESNASAIDSLKTQLDTLSSKLATDIAPLLSLKIVDSKESIDVNS
jgi:hypothetical protein